MLTKEKREELARLHAEATPGKWKLWAADVMADQDGTSDHATAKLVCRTYYTNERGQHRTNDAELIATMQRELPALLESADFAEQLSSLLDEALELVMEYRCQWGTENLAKKWELPEREAKIRERLADLHARKDPT